MSVNVGDVGETPENRGPSSSQSEGKAAVFSGMYGSPERQSLVFSLETFKDSKTDSIITE